MQYVVMEKFPEPYLITNEEGSVIIFDSHKEADKVAQELQDGQVVQLTLRQDNLNRHKRQKESNVLSNNKIK